MILGPLVVFMCEQVLRLDRLLLSYRVLPRQSGTEQPPKSLRDLTGFFLLRNRLRRGNGMKQKRR
jgi:hypothetical protein